MDPARRREAILAAALAVVRERGLAATTVREVAAELGSSPGLVHHYFDSMDELLALVFEQVAADGLQATVAAVQARHGAVARLVTYLDTYLRAGHEAAFQLWLDAWAEAARRPALREVSRRLNIAWQQVLADLIHEGVREGAFVCADPAATSWRLMSLLDGLVLQQVAHEIGFDRATVLAWGAAAAEPELGLPAGDLQTRLRALPTPHHDHTIARTG